MIKRKVYAVIFATVLVPFLRAVPAQAHGYKVVPQMIDGLTSDGTRWRTIFDFTSLTYSLSTPLTKVTLLFFHEDGSPWQVSIKNPNPSVTAPLTTSSVLLNLSPTQAIRIETLGTGSPAQGYAILRNLEATTDLPDDNQVTISVYYEIAKSNGIGGFDIFETVSVPAGQPTVSWAFPVEINNTKTPALKTAFAIVNLSDMPDISSNLYVDNTTNTVAFDLYGSDGTYQQTATFQLDSTTRKLARYVDQSGFFSNLPTTFRGTAFAYSTGPVAFLSLQETPTTTTTSTGVKYGQQYAMLVPTYLDSLRTNTFTLLPQGFSLDADIPVVDYFNDETSSVDSYYTTPWDLLYQTGNTTAERSLVPWNGTISSIGILSSNDFDALTVEDLSKLTYSTDPVDLSDTSTNLAAGFAFAIKTGLGNYAKVWIWNYVGYTDSYYIDLMLRIQVFK
jgi:hypothetical protein